MARIRTIKPSFFTSETVSKLTLAQRLTFIGLWTHVDDDGRCVDNPRLVKAAIWPLDDRTGADVESDLGALTEHSLITRYMVGGRRYLAVCGFREHQVINRRTKSAYPAPEEGEKTPIEDQATTTASSENTTDKTGTHGGSSEDSRSTHDRKGREGKGREKNTRVKRKRGDYSPEFERLWNVYPRKIAKDVAARAYEAALEHATAEEIEAGALSYRNDGARQRADIKFTAHLATWLNAGRWKDEPTEVIVPAQRPFWEN